MRINHKKLAAYRKTHSREIFCTKDRTYDIVIAHYLIEQSPRQARAVNVDELASTCGFDHRPIKEEDGYSFFLRPDGSKTVIDNEHYQKELDLNKSIIFADGQLIDGHHRLYRAFLLGIETLSAYHLTPEESKAC